MGMIGIEEDNNFKDQIVIQAPTKGADFQGVARTEETTLTDKSTLIEQERFNYQRLLSGESIEPVECVNLTGKIFYITDVLLSMISAEESAYLGDFNFGMANDAGEFDAVFDIPYAINGNQAQNINHHFDPPLLFQVIPIGFLGAIDEKWFSAKRDNANVAINFCVSGWFEK
jgi:hypothetical protein